MPWGNCTDIPLHLKKFNVSWTDPPVCCSVGYLDFARNPDATEEEIFNKMILHPEYGIRVAAMRTVVNRGWDHMVVPLLKAEDPRLREAGLLTITGMFKGRAFSSSALTKEMFELAGQMIEDPRETSELID